MELLRTGIVGTSRRDREKRVPIHPRHLDRVPRGLRSAISLETGYGKVFGFSDADLEARGVTLKPRDRLLAESELAIFPKPVVADLEEIPEGGAIWGWPHCVQQRAIAQAAIDRRQTLIAFESMFSWKGSRSQLHIFYKNNELAGYCGVLHALEVLGRDGLYGARQNAAVLSHGSVSRGAIHALQGRGFTNIRVYTQRPSHLVSDQIPGCRYRRMRYSKEDERLLVHHSSGKSRPLLHDLAEVDLIVNGILQDTDDPLMFLERGEESRLKKNTLIVDVSCDEGMGFPFARPTDFDDPIFRVGKAIYYGVDHTPTYLWDAASWEISKALLPYLALVMGGPRSWQIDETIQKAVEIQDGRIRNPKILSFQKREKEYPHAPVEG